MARRATANPPSPNGIRAAMGDHIYIPHALSYAGQVITMFDPIVHTKVEDGRGRRRLSPLRKSTTRHDTRYLLCTRPTVMTGGELMLKMLDLNYNAVSRTYQASLQLKSTGGVFIVDDLGRQEEPPQALINRWIVPMEAGYDILALQSGEKFEVPFDTLVVFSTNFHPNEIFDQAALRRIFFKVKIDGPNQSEFLKIFAMVAKQERRAAERGRADLHAEEEIPGGGQRLRELPRAVPDRPDQGDLRLRGDRVPAAPRPDRPGLGKPLRARGKDRPLTSAEKLQFFVRKTAVFPARLPRGKRPLRGPHGHGPWARLCSGP
jgi:hypothetical protein